MDFETALRIFEKKKSKNQYIKSLKKALGDIGSNNVYDIFSRIDEIYDQNKQGQPKYLIGFFSRIKSVYDGMTEDEKRNISDEDYKKLKSYAGTRFYKTNNDSISIHESETSSLSDDIELNEDDEEEKMEELPRLEVSKEEQDDILKKTMEELKISTEQVRKENDVLLKKMMDMKKTVDQVKRDNDILLNKMDRTKEIDILSNEVDALRKDNEKLKDIMKTLLKFAIKDEIAFELCNKALSW